MRTAPAIHLKNSYTVHVDSDELQCDVRKLPYPTCIGVVNVKTGKISVWTPAAAVPRGYKRAALEMLDQALKQLLTPTRR